MNGTRLFFFLITLVSCQFLIWARADKKFKPVTKCKRDGVCLLVSNPRNDDLPRDVEKGRLPSSLIPYHQNVELRPDIYTGGAPFPLDGEAELFVTCQESTDVIYLNALDLDIDPDSIEVTVADDSPIQPDPPEWTEFEADDNMEFLILSLDRVLTVGANYRVRMTFSGEMHVPAQSGFYWVSYNEDDETKYMAASQFAAHDARTAFPCFDEPGFKLAYNVTLVRQEPMIALSAMPVAFTENRGDGWLADNFETTPPMAAYYLCFAVCDFEYAEAVTPGGQVAYICFNKTLLKEENIGQTSVGVTVALRNNIGQATVSLQVRVWGRRDMIDRADYPLMVAAEFVDWFDEYLGVRYPLPKMDHIGIPTGSIFAMENWGLIAYTEGSLLRDPDYSTTQQMMQVARLISHEMAHQWFGDIVTCQWWDHTWLNEGFASAFQYAPMLDTLGWDGGEMHLDTYQGIMTSDNRNTTAPVRVEIETPWDAWDSFSSSAYNKGSCMVRMLKQIVGDATFQRAINRYLVDNYFGSVTTDDLWTAFAQQAAEDGITDTDGSPLDIKEKMDPWVEQSGHPVVTLQRQAGGVLSAYQHRFLSPPDQEVNEVSPWGYVWNIPLSYHTGEDSGADRTTKVWMDRENSSITEGIPDDTNEWLVANVGCTGFFRVDYDQDNRRAIVQQLLDQHDVLDAGSRAQFIYDTFNMVGADYYGEVEGFETTRYLGSEQNYYPWRNADSFLAYPSLMLARFDDTFNLHVSYMRSLAEPLYDYVGWTHHPDDSYELRQLRGIGLSLACDYNNPGCLGEAVALFDEWKNDVGNNPIHVDQRLTVYCSAIRGVGQENWDFAHTAYQQTADSSHHYSNTEVNTLLAAMACPDDQDLLNQYLTYMFDPELIQPNHATYAMTSLARGDYGGRWVVWEHLKTNWRDDPVPEGVSKNNIFSAVVDGFASSDDLQELEDFIEMYPAENPAEEATYEQALQTVQANNQWAAANVDDLDAWLQEHAPSKSLSHVTPWATRKAGHSLFNTFRSMEEISFEKRPPAK